jgi:hypothetical protein
MNIIYLCLNGISGIARQDMPSARVDEPVTLDFIIALHLALYFPKG